MSLANIRRDFRGEIFSSEGQRWEAKTRWRIPHCHPYSRLYSGPAHRLPTTVRSKKEINETAVATRKQIERTQPKRELSKAEAAGPAMERLQRIFGASGMGQPPTDSPLLDSSEQVYISSLALLKMLKHGA
jgi:hypothetical protein